MKNVLLNQGYALIQIPDLLLLGYDYLKERLVGLHAIRRRSNSDGDFQIEIVSNQGLQLRQSAERTDQIHVRQETGDRESHGKNEVVNKLLLLAIEEKIKGIVEKEMDRCMSAQS